MRKGDAVRPKSPYMRETVARVVKVRRWPLLPPMARIEFVEPACILGGYREWFRLDELEPIPGGG